MPPCSWPSCPQRSSLLCFLAMPGCLQLQAHPPASRSLPALQELQVASLRTSQWAVTVLLMGYSWTCQFAAVLWQMLLNCYQWNLTPTRDHACNGVMCPCNQDWGRKLVLMQRHSRLARYCMTALADRKHSDSWSKILTYTRKTPCQLRHCDNLQIT